MPQGLQIFDAAGNVVLDTSKLVMKRMISYPVTVTGTTPNTIPLSVPPTNTVLGVVTVPVSTSAVPERIATDVSGSDLVWSSRLNDGQSYRLDVLIV